MKGRHISVFELFGLSLVLKERCNSFTSVCFVRIPKRVDAKVHRIPPRSWSTNPIAIFVKCLLRTVAVSLNSPDSKKCRNQHQHSVQRAGDLWPSQSAWPMLRHYGACTQVSKEASMFTLFIQGVKAIRSPKNLHISKIL